MNSNNILNYCAVHLVKRNIRCYATNLKYPINTQDMKKLPVFNYSKSKSSYNRLFVWGGTATGALGLPLVDHGLKQKEYTSSPRRLQLAEKHVVSTIGCGLGFTVYGVDSNTEIKLYGTGINTDSQLGYHEIRTDKSLEVLYLPQPIYLPFKNPETAQIKQIAGGRAHLIVLTNEGLFMMGNNAYGQCGRKIISDEDYIGSKYVHHIPNIDGKDVTDIVCGPDHSLALTKDGSIYSCGWGAVGQTGLGHFNRQDKFTKVQGDITSERIVKVASRADFVLALNDKGEVFGWGNTEYGQMTNDLQKVCSPTLIKMSTDFGKIKDIATCGSFCIILNAEGHVFVWGYGLLGIGPGVQSTKIPIQIPPNLFGMTDFQPEIEVETVVCGFAYLGAITSHGDLFIWGRNRNQGLGLDTEKDHYFPLRVSVGGFAQKAFCGVNHTVAFSKPFI